MAKGYIPHYFLQLITILTGLLFFIRRRKKVVHIADDIELYTESFGKRSYPAVLLISGAGPAQARFWSDYFCKKLVDAGYLVIRYDHRDVGLSSAVYDKQPYKLKDLAEDALSILDAYDIKKAHIIGHSMGGYIAQWLAVYHPERVLSIISISAGPVGATDKTDEQLTDEQQALLDKTWQIMLANKPTPYFAESVDGYLTVMAYLHGDIPMDEKRARAYIKDYYTRSKHMPGVVKAHVAVMHDMGHTINERRGLLQSITVPTLVIHGQRDTLQLLERTGKPTAQAIPEAQLVIIPGMGHMILNRTLEDMLLEHIIPFLDEHTKE